MHKHLNHLKYKILLRLLRELCDKSRGCRICNVYTAFRNEMPYSCYQSFVVEQAKKVWGIKNDFWS